jgi:hypothetical protein
MPQNKESRLAGFHFFTASLPRGSLLNRMLCKVTFAARVLTQWRFELVINKLAGKTFAIFEVHAIMTGAVATSTLITKRGLV